MKEEELGEALHDLMVRTTPPPSMDPASALDQGRRALKRRRIAVTGAAAVTLAVGLGAGPALVVHYAGSRPASPMVAGGTGTSRPLATPRPVSTVTPKAPATRKSGDPWPEGQTDRTATAGPRADRAVTLMNELSSSVPAGFTSPNLKYPDGLSMRWPQAQYASNDGEQDYWQYQATIPVQKGDRVGKLLASSTTPDGKPALTPCKLAQKFWGGTGSCTVVDVAGKKVGVLTTNGHDSYDQWAVYRYADGTVVYVAQAKKSDSNDRPPLQQPVFTARQLAELATSPNFKIST
ncbi:MULTISPECIES: hypothetical protein [Kribbella]|uniref:Uncharacterized protein n=1 Tax=Kribbella karoonensis TaxID=324851 RepID=A0ABP4PY40_9ACTN